MNEVRIIPVQGIPEIEDNDNLAEITYDVIKQSEIGFEKNDIFVVTQKIVSKSEGMERDLSNFNFEELLQSESKKIIRKRGDLVISKTNHGFICANAGIDKSNVKKIQLYCCRKTLINQQINLEKDSNLCQISL